MRPAPAASDGPLARLSSIDDGYEVFPENADSVRLFEKVIGCWRVCAGFKGLMYLGLDYPSVRAVMDLAGIPRKQWPALFRDLQVMEVAALDEIRLIQQANQR